MLLYFVSIILILLIKFEVATSNSSKGYHEKVQSGKNVIAKDPYKMRSCRIFQYFCPEYRNQSINTLDIKFEIKTRIKRGCGEGYIFDEGNCYPYCKEPCRNASCTHPDTCTCYPGYEPTTDSHRCQLKCSSGFQFNEDSKQCETICTSSCTKGTCFGSCDVCHCVNLLFTHQFQPLSVHKLCFMSATAAVFIALIACSFCLCLYRKCATRKHSSHYPYTDVYGSDDGLEAVTEVQIG